MPLEEGWVYVKRVFKMLVTIGTTGTLPNGRPLQ